MTVPRFLLFFILLNSLASYSRNDKPTEKQIDSLLKAGYTLISRDINNAFILCDSAYRISEKIGYEKGKGKSLNYIAGIYELQGKSEQALEVFKEVIKIFTNLNDTSSLISAYENIAITYAGQRKFQTAREFLDNALMFSKKLGKKSTEAIILMNIGGTYETEGDQNKALELYQKSLKLFSGSTENRSRIKCMNNIGYIYYAQGKYRLSEEMLENTIREAQSFGLTDIISSCEEILADIYLQQKQYEKSLIHYKNFITSRDSLYRQENARQMQELQVAFQTGRRLRQIELLNTEKEKRELLSERDKLESRIIIASVLSLLILIAVFASFLFKRYKITSHQKMIIEEKNREITDSINYALRIQESKLHGQQDLLELFPESFVLNKPKDIVSGDFYFVKRKDGLLFIACADCTGHGVPGAFVSIIGSEKLVDAVNRFDEPAQILSELNDSLKISLKQNASGSGTRDGMDIALCSVDPAKHILRYSGANRPLWIIRQNKLIEIKATKTAIAGHTQEGQIFAAHTIPIEPGDMVYIFSDGYADTFNGHTDKKLTTKKFKQLLMDIAHKPAGDQCNSLDKFIEDWKSGTSQVDDILVLGFRV
ncbi:MAG: tetratricopeptide repeat protein [Bacteroidota bacterium]|nr:tetratricopeptide repeat protein [Bacteroidota bacterium]